MQCGDYTYRAIDTGAEIMEYYGKAAKSPFRKRSTAFPL